ncbi:LT_GEWL domain containing protein [uncultured Caudovirales phage]|uniref:LT_GEWL domain containing protein n=1 Tax=uncultured Caudovirales phage TaxID=2100421 RepID=A0A6J5Q9J7_9CAUD|nr:LT_GEWL domain containing protein [uncultured Caudovirales phage]CAB4180182.1 LT_GEWL domain containing protein [uncultured Caudovirales phage]CAB4180907.1 LT_GEWL domain containing protein [uncultured Caudovirales phage]CAB4222925.1 LT_GEWL domain containing protein [uncultured Caudovirales phage]
MSYPQMINTCGNTPKITRNYCYLLTRGLRSVLSTRAAKAGSSRRATLTGVLLLSIALTDISYGDESKDINNYKLYAHSRVIDYKQFVCLEKAWTQESNWNPRAIGNRSGKQKAYGIPQIKNDRVKALDPYTQIDYGLRYIKHRYSNDSCLMLKHLTKHGWA